MYLAKYGYGDYLKQMESDGKWEMVKSAQFKKYQNIEEGEKLGRYEAVAVSIYAYRKL